MIKRKERVERACWKGRRDPEQGEQKKRKMVGNRERGDRLKIE